MGDKISNLQVKSVVRQSTAPQSNKLSTVWIDTSSSPAVTKTYDDSSDSWKSLGNTIDDSSIIELSDGDIATGFWESLRSDKSYTPGVDTSTSGDGYTIVPENTAGGGAVIESVVIHGDSNGDIDLYLEKDSDGSELERTTVTLDADVNNEFTLNWYVPEKAHLDWDYLGTGNIHNPTSSPDNTGVIQKLRGSGVPFGADGVKGIIVKVIE